MSIDIEEWIKARSLHPVEHRRRQAVEVLVKAISSVASVRDTLFLKGGTLMNLAYQSPRLTTDVDFTTSDPREGFDEKISAVLNRAMNLAALDLGYPHLLFRVQATEMRPPQEDFPWPTLRMSIGFADRGSSQENRLALGQAANVLHVDISFNEPVYDWQEVEIRNGSDVGEPEEEHAVILAYSVHELVAEKLRAIVQQKIRNRYRRQDIYDIARLLSQRTFTMEEVAKVFAIFLEKCRNRDIAPTRGLMSDQELYERSREKYAEMRFDQTSISLDFEEDFARIVGFYQAMPWPP